MASASGRPWVLANGWRFLRKPDGRYWGDVPAGKAALAAAEAFAYGADVVLAIDPADLEVFGRMRAFLSALPDSELPPAADIAVVDDGSPPVAEVLNLMARRNLLFRVAQREAPDVALNVRVGSKEFSRKDAQNPEAFALSVRRRLTDEKRSLVAPQAARRSSPADARGLARSCTSSTTAADRSTGCASACSGSWVAAEARVFGEERMAVEDQVTADGATEFSLGLIGYVIVDLTAAK